MGRTLSPGRDFIMVTAADLHRCIGGVWAVHATGRSVVGNERFARRPKAHLIFDGPAWRRHDTSRPRRLQHAATSAGFWRTIDVDGRVLLVLTVRSHRASRVSTSLLEMNYGYTGGALAVIAARTGQETEALKMRDGEALMFFLPVSVDDDVITVTLPSDGLEAPRQRWVRRP